MFRGSTNRGLRAFSFVDSDDNLIAVAERVRRD